MARSVARGWAGSLVTAAIVVLWLGSGWAAAQRGRGPAERSAMDSVAQQYVRVVLALGQHDADYVDAYYGPPEWKQEAAASKLDPAAIGERAARPRGELQAAAPRRETAMNDDLERLRYEYLDRQLSAVQARVRMLT